MLYNRMGLFTAARRWQHRVELRYTIPYKHASIRTNNSILTIKWILLFQKLLLEDYQDIYVSTAVGTMNVSKKTVRNSIVPHSLPYDTKNYFMTIWLHPLFNNKGSFLSIKKEASIFRKKLESYDHGNLFLLHIRESFTVLWCTTVHIASSG